MSENRIVEENVQPAGTMVESYARGTGQVIPAVLASASYIELVPRRDDPTRFYRNEVADLILKDPNSDRLYTQRKVLINWHVERDNIVPGLDADPDTGEVWTIAQLKDRVKAFIRAQAISASEVSTETAGAVLED